MVQLSEALRRSRQRSDLFLEFQGALHHVRAGWPLSGKLSLVQTELETEADATEAAGDGETQLPASTTPRNLQVSVIGITNDEWEEGICKTVRVMAHDFGRWVPLHDLDGITIAVDYLAAVRALDRGIDGDEDDWAPSDDGIVVGQAVASPVMRDGKVKTHVILDIDRVLGLFVDDPEANAEGTYLIIHELAHCAEHSELIAGFPSPHRTLLPLEIDRTYYEMVKRCWAEYFACRMSAFAWSGALPQYDDTFGTAIATIPAGVMHDKLMYRMHGNLQSFFLKASGDYDRLMKYASYVFGHLDGSGEPVSSAPQMAAALNGEYGEALRRLWEALNSMWDKRGAWNDDASVFQPLFVAAAVFLDRAGLTLSPIDDKMLHVDVR